MKHKFLNSFMCLALTATALTGCGNGSEEPKSTPTPVVQDNKEGTEPTKDPGSTGNEETKNPENTQTPEDETKNDNEEKGAPTITK
ncbi:MAG: hypothetical protein K2O71_02995, partial [Lachnospiraceae bacterium]|nr:hypothetical protein [Lachnospiraceae bacterium]